MPREKSSGKPTTRRYTDGEKDQAVRLVRQLREELGTSAGTVARVADQLGYGVESVRTWVRERDVADGLAGPDAQRVRELAQQNRELDAFMAEHSMPRVAYAPALHGAKVVSDIEDQG